MPSEDISDWVKATLDGYKGVNTDTASLAKLIVVLVDKRKSISSLKTKCRDKLPEFLGDSTDDFVHRLERKLDQKYEKSPRRERTPPRRRHESPLSDDEHSPRAGRKRRSDDYRYDRDRPYKRRDYNYQDRDRERGRERERGSERELIEYSDDENPGLASWSETDSNNRSNRDKSFGRRDHRGRGRNQRKSDRKGKNFNSRDSCTLGVRSIPPEHNSIATLNEHFSQFGTIVNIDVKYSQNMAFVKFTHHNSAYKAYKSPQPIFGNRFIKLFWQNENETPAASSIPPVAPTTKPTFPKSFSIVNSTPEQEIEKKLIEQQKELVKALQSPDLSKEKKVELYKQLKDHMAAMETALKKDAPVTPSTPVDAAKQKLDQQLDEYKSQSDDTREAMKEKLHALQQTASYMRGRGGLRGRGRGRGRGASYRGRGGSIPMHRGTMSIDNRTCIIKINEPPEALLDEATLTEHFKAFGTLEDIHIADAFATVTFRTRKSAQIAMSRGNSYDGISLDITWQEKEVEEGEGKEAEEEEETENKEAEEKPKETADGLSSDEDF